MSMYILTLAESELTLCLKYLSKNTIQASGKQINVVYRENNEDLYTLEPSAKDFLSDQRIKILYAPCRYYEKGESYLSQIIVIY